jgi:hypothetical protein
MQIWKKIQKRKRKFRKIYTKKKHFSKNFPIFLLQKEKNY